MNDNKKELSPEQSDELLNLLKIRFEKNRNRHTGLDWAAVQARLDANPEKLWSLNEMERTGGEPDVIARDAETDEVIFFDCSPETPQGRRNLCYDEAALAARKANPPEGSALEMAAVMGIDILTEAQYRLLQTLGHFDAKTSSWLATPAEIRTLDGAIFGDYRYGTVFVYHNGASSYYGVRGFRGSLRV